ncbi:MAG: DUF523 domain-containing protein [Clostridium sp.]|nr:DUF523 domain-containing protein [Clostridium sp.]
MYLVSACLCGVNCKYNGKNNLNKDCLRLLQNNEAILICPEQLGGLTTPREPSEIQKNAIDLKDEKVVTKDGVDVTENFVKGAEEVLAIAKKSKINTAILKEGSPSCGCNFIYDGSFSGKKIKGEGITSKLLKSAGINVISDEEYSLKLKKDNNLVLLSDYKNEIVDEESSDENKDVIYSIINSDDEEVVELPLKVELEVKKLMVLMAEEMLGMDNIDDIVEVSGLSYEEIKEIMDKKE